MRRHRRARNQLGRAQRGTRPECLAGGSGAAAGAAAIAGTSGQAGRLAAAVCSAPSDAGTSRVPVCAARRAAVSALASRWTSTAFTWSARSAAAAGDVVVTSTGRPAAMPPDSSPVSARVGGASQPCSQTRPSPSTPSPRRSSPRAAMSAQTRRATSMASTLNRTAERCLTTRARSIPSGAGDSQRPAGDARTASSWRATASKASGAACAVRAAARTSCASWSRRGLAGATSPSRVCRASGFSRCRTSSRTGVRESAGISSISSNTARR